MPVPNISDIYTTVQTVITLGNNKHEHDIKKWFLVTEALKLKRLWIQIYNGAWDQEIMTNSGKSTPNKSAPDASWISGFTYCTPIVVAQVLHCLISNHIQRPEAEDFKH